MTERTFVPRRLRQTGGPETALTGHGFTTMLDTQQTDSDAERAAAARATGLIDSAPEERFDRYTRLARRLFGVPVALVTLLDDKRVFYKSRQGIAQEDAPRDGAFCEHTIAGDDVFFVENVAVDERFARHPMVAGEPGVRFYAGCPLVNVDGYRIGTVCLIDYKPRKFSEDDASTLRDIASMVASEMTALQLSTVDQVTGLSNRRAFQVIAEQALAMCARNSGSATLLMFDIDRFRHLNERFGHSVGDSALKAFGHLMRDAFRDSDVVARLGGDEFCVLLTGATMEQAWACVERFRNAVNARNAERGKGYKLGFHAGVVQFNVDRHTTVDQLLDEAGQMMLRRRRARPLLAPV